jgi:uncharacterized membrane protein
LKDSLIYLVQRLLKINQIYFDKDELGFQIQSHPSYPSLHAVTGVLDHFNIDNVAVTVPLNLETLEQLPDCFMAELTINNSKSLAVVERKKLNYEIYRAEHKKETVTKDTFLERFTGIVVAVEKPEGSQVKTKSSKLGSYISLGLLVVLASFLVFNTSVSIYNIVYLVLSIIGVVISVAIVKQELGIKTSIGDAFCSGMDTKKDCNAVLSSKGAEIIKGYKLSDFGLVYFSVLTVITFIQIQNPVLSFLVTVLAIPITLYSLYYQSVVIKKWCLLCLSSIGILWLQALIPLIEKNNFTEFVLNEVIVFGIVIIAVSIAWHYIKRLVLEVNNLRKDKIEGVKFKRNFELFETMLNKATELNTSIIESEEIIFGNHKSSLEIIVITSPFCGHCRPVHKQIHDILQKYNENVKIKIRFNIGTQDENSPAVKIATALIEIYREKGEYECLLAMTDIYENGDHKNWLKTWGDYTQKEWAIIELKKEHTWCSDNAIHFTPEILINGKSFPKAYNRADLILFIEELEESSNQNASANIEMKTV